ncbi:MAG: hypothetical protein K6C97_02705 [Treponema sp.]|nr:hypothetical protein [Treponema sp.]
MRKVKILISSLFVFMLASFAFAYDGDVLSGECIGQLSRKEFMEEVSDPDEAEEMFESSMDGFDLIKFYQVTEDNLDEEDYQLMSDVQDYIVDNYDFNNKDCFLHLIKRGDIDDGLDGWMVFSHYSSSASSDFLHYIYYFAIAME